VRRLAWPPHRLAQVGGLGAALALAVATLAPALPVLAAAMALLGAALGLLIPGNLAALSLRAGSAAQARGAGLNAIGQGFGFAAGPIMGAGLHQMAPWVPYAAATVLLVLVCCVVFQRRIFAD
jgi:MFS family permease